MDSLDYGRRFTVDGYRLDSLLEEAPETQDFMLDLHAVLEGDRTPRLHIRIEEDDGYSAAICGSEAHAVVHVFPGMGTVSLQVLSRRDVLLSDLTSRLSRRFGVGRFESHLANATKALPRQAGRLEMVLVGDRSYTRVRLQDGHS